MTGDKVFQPKEWLKEAQIKSFFSRCYTAQKKSGVAPSVVETRCVCERCHSGAGLETETEDYTAELEPEVDKTHVYIMHYTTYRRDIPLVHFSSSNSCFTQTQSVSIFT